jgi:hypothetical protein
MRRLRPQVARIRPGTGRCVMAANLKLRATKTTSVNRRGRSYVVRYRHESK